MNINLDFLTVLAVQIRVEELFAELDCEPHQDSATPASRKLLKLRPPVRCEVGVLNTREFSQEGMLVEAALWTVTTGNQAKVNLFRKLIPLPLRILNHVLLPKAAANRKYSDL